MRDLPAIIRRTDAVIEDRLRHFLRAVNLFNYEGTIVDQLALDYIQRSSARDKIHVFCSERPCMSPELQGSVRRFAGERQLHRIQFEKDCVVKPERNGFVSVECSKVGPYIKSYLRGKDGVHIVASIMNEDTRGNFEGMNDFFESFAMEQPFYARNRDKHNDWYILFLFEGCDPFDVVVSYIHHFGKVPAVHDVPLCYLPCYHERELMKMIDIIETQGHDIQHELTRFARASAT